jgi:hypothetical protein
MYPVEGKNASVHPKEFKLNFVPKVLRFKDTLEDEFYQKY